MCAVRVRHAQRACTRALGCALAASSPLLRVGRQKESRRQSGGAPFGKHTDMMSLIENHPVFPLISSREEVNELAQELASHYLEYFHIDTREELEKYQDAVEECLAHLEEVISSLEELKQHHGGVGAFAETVDAKRVDLGNLYARVDEIQQYIFETSKHLDLLETQMLELERRLSSKSSRIKQIIGKLFS
jgi:BMFP domain-containing protein YqiC